MADAPPLNDRSPYWCFTVRLAFCEPSSPFTRWKKAIADVDGAYAFHRQGQWKLVDWRDFGEKTTSGW